MPKSAKRLESRHRLSGASGAQRLGLRWLDAAPEEAVLFVRRFLRLPRFQTNAARLGMVARVHHDGVQFWQRQRAALQQVEWAER